MSKSHTLRCSFNQSGNISYYKLFRIKLYYTKLWNKRCKRIISNFWFSFTNNRK